MRGRRLFLAASLLGAVAVTDVGRSSASPPGSAVFRGNVTLGGAPVKAQVTLWSVASHRGTDLPRRGWYGRTSARTTLERFVRDDTVVGSVATDAAGSFQWRDLPPGFYRVTATGADGHAAWSDVRKLRAGQHVVVELDLEPFRETLRGRVVGLEALEPPVRVLAIPSLHGWGLSSSVGPRPQGVGPDGRFSVEGLPSASVVVAVADARGLRALSRSADLPQEAELEIDCDANQVVVEGVVAASPGGAPIAGAEVMAWPEHVGDLIEGLPGPVATADEAGRFRLRVPKRGWSLVGRAPGFLPSRAPTRSPVQISLARETTVRGRLLEAGTLRPVAGVTVYALLEDAWGEAPEATSDAEGRFALSGLTGGTYTLVARGADWISTNLVRDAEPTPHIELVRAASVRGRLLDAAGAPVVGATVHASPVDSDWRPHRADGLPYQALVAGLESGVTGPDGAFELLGLAPGREYWVGATPLTPPPPPEHRVRASEKEGPPIELRIPATRGVWVKVVSASDGAPIEGAHVTLMGEEARVGDGDEDEDESSHVTSLDTIASGRTDAQGRVRLGATGSGKLWVGVDARRLLARAFRGLDGRTYEPDATIEGEPSMTLRLAPAASGVVQGRVLLPNGAPAAEVELRLRVELGKGSSQRFPTVSREDGSFTFEAVPEGALTLRAIHRGDDGVEHSGVLRDLPRNEQVVLRLGAGLPRDTLVVRVVDPKGFPVAAAVGQFRTKDTGFHSRDLVQGHAEFQVDEEVGEKVGDDGVEGEIVVEEARDGTGSPLPLGRTRLAGVRTGRTVEVQMAPELAIEGQVLDGAEKGVPGVKVRAQPVEPDQDVAWMERPGGWSHVPYVVTNEEGRFRVGQLGPGPHRVLILPPKNFAPVASQPAEAGAREMRFTLRPAVRATLRVQEEGGRPVARARVVVTFAGEDPDEIGVSNALSEHSGGIEQSTDELGEVRLQGLDPGRRYIVGIAPPRSRTDLAEHVAPAWQPGDTRVRLGRGHALAGLVLDRWGKPVAGAMVSCRRASGVDTRAHTGKDGAFRFESLPAGRVELEARVLDDERPRRWAQAKAEAGETDVVLWLVPGR